MTAMWKPCPKPACLECCALITARRRSRHESGAASYSRIRDAGVTCSAVGLREYLDTPASTSRRLVGARGREKRSSGTRELLPEIFRTQIGRSPGKRHVELLGPTNNRPLPMTYAFEMTGLRHHTIVLSSKRWPIVPCNRRFQPTPSTTKGPVTCRVSKEELQSSPAPPAA